MPSHAITAEFIASLQKNPQNAKAVFYFDTEITGFLVEHRPSGNATYYFRYRNAMGKVRMESLGRSEALSPQEARTMAYKMWLLVKEGGDPKLEGYRFKEVPTFDAFVGERYMPFVMNHKRSWRCDDALVRTHLLPRFAGIRMNRITRADVTAMHQEMKEKQYAAGTCNRLLVLLRYIFNCAIRWDILPPTGNPCQGVKEFEDNGARERYLTHGEVRKLFEELDNNPNVQVGQVIRLLLFTGARKREILDARWEHIDFARRILTVPISKSGKPRHIALSDAAIELLRSQPREAEMPWVFFNPKTGKPPVSIFSAWDTIRKKVGLSEVRLHDLRHSYASFLVNAGRSLYEVQRLLGHHDPKVTMRYAHLSQGALVDAANVVGKVVEKAVRRHLPALLHP